VNNDCDDLDAPIRNPWVTGPIRPGDSLLTLRGLLLGVANADDCNGIAAHDDPARLPTEEQEQAVILAAIELCGIWEATGRDRFVYGALIRAAEKRLREAVADYGADVPVVLGICEGCTSPATTRDSMGVPLCAACYDALEPADLNENDCDGGPP
jgi:hypothetical protein